MTDCYAVIDKGSGCIYFYSTFSTIVLALMNFFDVVKQSDFAEVWVQELGRLVCLSRFLCLLNNISVSIFCLCLGVGCSLCLLLELLLLLIIRRLSCMRRGLWVARSIQLLSFAVGRVAIFISPQISESFSTRIEDSFLGSHILELDECLINCFAHLLFMYLMHQSISQPNLMINL